ncbi:MAG: hypothetical protein O3A55_04755 [Bacteroidetes bacterium]|nr:hypothetical protein [Bacteroidota bacterium]
MDKKFWLAVLVTFILLGLMEPIVHAFFLANDWGSDSIKAITRAEYKFIVFYVAYAFMAFGLTFIYSKGHENLGVAEGIRFGFYMSLISFLPVAYFTYALFPITYGLTLKWYLAGMIELLIIGIVLNKLFTKK